MKGPPKRRAFHYLQDVMAEHLREGSVLRRLQRMGARFGPARHDWVSADGDGRLRRKAQPLVFQVRTQRRAVGEDRSQSSWPLRTNLNRSASGTSGRSTREKTTRTKGLRHAVGCAKSVMRRSCIRGWVRRG